MLYRTILEFICRSQWPRGVRCRSAAARLLRLWVRIPPWALMFVCCECRVLSGRSPWDELITRPEESYRLWCVVVCDLETSWMRRSWSTGGPSSPKQTKKTRIYINEISHLKVVSIVYSNIRDLQTEDSLKRKVEICSCHYLLKII